LTLNDLDEMSLILRYFTKFGSFPGRIAALRKIAWQRHNYGQFSITMSSSKRRLMSSITGIHSYIT